MEPSRSYPASLYDLSRDHKLHLVRQFFKAGEDFSGFADDLHGTIYLAGGNGIYVVHEADPARADFVPVAAFDDSFCWGAVYGRSAPPSVQYCREGHITRIDANPIHNQPRIGAGSWAAFKFLQFGGENGGPFQIGPPKGEVDGANIVMPRAVSPDVALAQLPPEYQASPKLRRRVWILASTDRYLLVWILPESMGAFGPAETVDAAHPPFHATPLHVLLLDKRTHQWKALTLPTTVSTLTYAPVRIFGNWLVTMVMGWSPILAGSPKARLGLQNAQKPPMVLAPGSIRDEYLNRYLDIHIPGKLVLRNLADHRKLTLTTNQEDSEVLAIRGNGDDGSMLYRIDSAIYSARIEGGRIFAPTLLVKGPAVAEIHWAFWSNSL